MNSKPHKILLLAPQPFFAKRGTPFNVKAIATALAKGGYEVDLLVYPQGESIELPENVNLIRCPGLPGIKNVPAGPSWAKFFLDFPFSLKAFALALRGKYSVVHGVEEGAIIAGVLSAILRTPYVFDMDSCMPEQLESAGVLKSKNLSSIVRNIESYFVKKATAVLTVCQALTDKAKEISPNSLVYQIEDFPLDSANEVNQSFVENLRKQFKLEGRSVILYTGNFSTYQGIDLLLESLKSLKELSSEAAKKACLLLVGGGDAPEQLKHYQELVGKMGLADDVVFAGQQPPESMGSFMALSDALVSPRTVGGNTPLKIYSYMAAERPIIATDISSHTQVLNFDNSYLAAPDSNSFSKAMEQALSETFENLSVKQARVAQAKKLVDTKYSKKEFERRVVELYQNILGEQSSAYSKAA